MKLNIGLLSYSTYEMYFNVFIGLLNSIFCKVFDSLNGVILKLFNLFDNLYLLLLFLFLCIYLVMLLFIFVINIQKGYSLKMNNLPKSNPGRYGNKNALKNKEYYTDDSDDDDEDCIGYCKEEKIFIEMKNRFEAKQTFDRVISSYPGVNCGLFSTGHDKTLDFEVLLKNFYKIKQKKKDCPELNFTKLVNHYVASWEKNPLGNATYD